MNHHENPPLYSLQSVVIHSLHHHPFVHDHQLFLFNSLTLPTPGRIARNWNQPPPATLTELFGQITTIWDKSPPASHSAPSNLPNPPILGQFFDHRRRQHQLLPIYNFAHLLFYTYTITYNFMFFKKHPKTKQTYKKINKLEFTRNYNIWVNLKFSNLLGFILFY